MKKILVFCLALILAFGCIPVVYATETTEDTRIQVSLPELPEFTYEDPYPETFPYTHSFVLKIVDEYYAVLFLHSVASPNLTLKSTEDTATGLRYVQFRSGVRYVYSYQLVDDDWVLIYETESVSDSTMSENLFLPSVQFSLTDWKYGYDNNEVLVYSSENFTPEFWRGDRDSAGNKEIVASDYYNLTFTTADSGGSSEGGGFTGGWSDEDKGWLGNLFDDLFSFFNNWWSTKIQPKLDSITTSIGNFIDNAISSVGNFFNNLTSTITGLFNTLSTWIDNARTKLEEFFTGIWDSVKDWWLNDVCAVWEERIQSIKDWWLNDVWKPVEEYFAEQKELREQKEQVSEELNQSFEDLFNTLVEVQLKPIVDFFDSLSEGAIMIWIAFFNLPFIRELTLGVVLVAIFSGILTLLLTF